MSPIAAIIHPNAFGLVDTLLEKGGWTAEQVRRAQDELPCLLRILGKDISAWPQIFPIVEEMRNVSENSFGCTLEQVKEMEASGQSLARAPVINLDDSCSNFAREGSWAPGKGILRDIPCYEGAVRMSTFCV